MKKLISMILCSIAIPLCFAACGGDGGPAKPGEACSGPEDCGCWKCTCEGQKDPAFGASCPDKKCATGEKVCEDACGFSGGGKVTKSEQVDFKQCDQP